MRLHHKQALDRERHSIVQQLEQWLDLPLTGLALVWLALLIVELARGLTPGLELAGTAIWAIFILEFLLRFAITPRKAAFLRSHAFELAALLLPAVRALRITMLVRGARGMRLFRLVASLNRGMHALSAVMGRRGLRYVLAATLLVVLAGAGAMYGFERNSAGPGLNDYPTALWWTAMMLTTMGSDYWPRTPEGRLLCLALAVYAFAVFGYITAAIASFFVARDAANPATELAGSPDLRVLRDELRAMRAELRAMSGRRPAA